MEKTLSKTAKQQILVCTRVLTNYHVISDATSINVTLTSGNGYTATVLGSDKFKDLVVLSTDATQNEYLPLEIISSSTLSVGDDPVIVVGTPYGLAGSMSEGKSAP